MLTKQDLLSFKQAVIDPLELKAAWTGLPDHWKTILGAEIARRYFDATRADDGDVADL